MSRRCVNQGLFFSSHEPKLYQWFGVRPSVVHRPQCINILFSKPHGKFYKEPPWVGGVKVCSRHLGHMTKMAATPINGKTPSKIFFSGTSGERFKRNLVCSMEDSCTSQFVQMMSWSDLDLFYGKVKFGYSGFSIGKGENSGFFRNYCSL